MASEQTGEYREQLKADFLDTLQTINQIASRENFNMQLLSVIEMHFHQAQLNIVSLQSSLYEEFLHNRKQ